MITLGIAAIEQPEWPPFGKQRFYFEDILAAADSLPIRFFFFSPLHWQADADLVSGYMFQKGEWIKTLMPLPTFIYDRAFSPDSQVKEKLNSFRNFVRQHAHIHMLNPVDLGLLLDDKVAFHHFLSKHQIPTLEANSPLWLLDNADFEQTSAYYLKPISGSGGNGIFVLEKINSGFRLSNHTHSDFWTFPNLSAVLDFLAQQSSLDTYFVQGKANVSPYEGQPYDLRVLIQNHGHCDYYITGMALRIGQQGSNVSNLQAGGTALPLEMLSDYFEVHFGRPLEEEILRIHQLSADCCQVLHQNFGNFLEIGLDFLLTTDQGPLIMEGNTRPSRWIFNVLADRFVDDTEKSAFYKGLRNKSVLIPSLFTIANS